MNSILMIILSIISLKVLLNTKKGIIDMNYKPNDYKPNNNQSNNNQSNNNQSNNNQSIDDRPDNDKSNDYSDKYIFLSNINHCPQKFKDNFDKLFTNKKEQLPGYTDNDYLDLTRYNNNKYKTPQPINM
jgi:hypothetical protein